MAMADVKCTSCTNGYTRCTNFGCHFGKVKCTNWACSNGRCSVPGSSSTYSCNTCQGTGKSRCTTCNESSYGMRCPACSGRGTIRAFVPDPDKPAWQKTMEGQTAASPTPPSASAAARAHRPVPTAAPTTAPAQVPSSLPTPQAEPVPRPAEPGLLRRWLQRMNVR